MQQDEWKRCLLLYGADIEQWPETLRHRARRVEEISPQFRRWRQEEAAFERAAAQEIMPPSGDFTARMIAAALPRSGPLRRSLWQEIRALLPLPRPAYAMGAVVAAGFIAGFFEAEQPQVALGDFLYDNTGLIDEPSA